MWIPDFVIKWFGWELGKELKEGQNMPWYQNKSTLGHIFTALVGVSTTIATLLTTDFGTTIPSWAIKGGGILLTLASAIGIYDNHSS